MELGRLVAIWFRRLPLIGLLGVLCAVGAWLVVRDEPTVYEQELSFAVRPGDRVPIEGAEGVAATLSNRESAVIQTILGLVDSVRLPQATGTSPVERTTTLRPGSAIIDVNFRSEDRDAIGPLAQSYSALARDVVARSYRIYELEPLGDGGPPEAVESKIWRTLALAFFLGCALGAAVATLEHRARDGRRNAKPAEPQEPELDLVVDVANRIDRIEAALREGLEPGETVVRAGPARLVIVQDETPSAQPGAAES